MENLFRLFEKYSVRTLLSEQGDGSMKIDHEDDRKNRARFLKKHAIPIENIIAPHQAHGPFAQLATTNFSLPLNGIDALTTPQKDTFLSVTVADCLPVYFFDPQTQIIGLAHAGWRGIIKGIIKSTLSAFAHEGSASSNIIVGIGPGVGPCHFEIKDDVYTQIPPEAQRTVKKKDGSYFWDLKEVIASQLQSQNISKQNIEIHPDCTYCRADTYFSYRREQPELNVMVAIIGTVNA